MLSKDLQDAVARYYATAHGESDTMVGAFDRACDEFIAADIEWVESFGTLNGVEQVKAQLVGAHTQLLSNMRWTVDHAFPGAGGDRAVVLGQFTAQLPNGAEVNPRFVHVWEFDGDRAVRFLAFEQD